MKRTETLKEERRKKMREELEKRLTTTAEREVKRKCPYVIYYLG
jgi:hypothetical protein